MLLRGDTDVPSSCSQARLKRAGWRLTQSFMLSLDRSAPSLHHVGLAGVLVFPLNTGRFLWGRKLFFETWSQVAKAGYKLLSFLHLPWSMGLQVCTASPWQLWGFLVLESGHLCFLAVF